VSVSVRFDANWTYHGCRALVLENSQVRAVILPEMGAKIWSLVYKPVDREMLWHNPRLPPRPAPFGARYDDWFCGGWDELFPNDAPVTIGGEPYPDHGELWSMPFAWEAVAHSPREVTIRLWRPGVVTTTRYEKRITLRRDEPTLRFRHIIENDGPFPLDFLWKLHPALAIGPEARIDLPAGLVRIDEAFQEGFSGSEFVWPHAADRDGRPIDMRRVPPPSAATAHFYYAVELTDGWCALTDARERVGFGLVFDPAVLKTVWVFGAYGGWRGLYTTILEPCNGHPYELDKAIAQGTCGRLGPGERLETEVVAVLYRGLDRVGRISPDGEVR
jgi:hypothetical protein